VSGPWRIAMGILVVAAFLVVITSVWSTEWIARRIDDVTWFWNEVRTLMPR